MSKTRQSRRNFLILCRKRIHSNSGWALLLAMMSCSSRSKTERITNMHPDMQTLIDAGRLIQWALRPHARPATEEEYQHLVDRYRDQVPFRECVQAICRGLGVAVTAAGQRGV